VTDCNQWLTNLPLHVSLLATKNHVQVVLSISDTEIIRRRQVRTVAIHVLQTIAVLTRQCRVTLQHSAVFIRYAHRSSERHVTLAVCTSFKVSLFVVHRSSILRVLAQNCTNKLNCLYRHDRVVSPYYCNISRYILRVLSHLVA